MSHLKPRLKTGVRRCWQTCVPGSEAHLQCTGKNKRHQIQRRNFSYYHVADSFVQPINVRQRSKNPSDLLSLYMVYSKWHSSNCGALEPSGMEFLNTGWILLTGHSYAMWCFFFLFISIPKGIFSTTGFSSLRSLILSSLVPRAGKMRSIFWVYFCIHLPASDHQGKHRILTPITDGLSYKPTNIQTSICTLLHLPRAFRMDHLTHCYNRLLEPYRGGFGVCLFRLLDKVAICSHSWSPRICICIYLARYLHNFSKAWLLLSC